MNFSNMTLPISPAHVVTYDGAVLKIFHADKGQGLLPHKHDRAHLTMCHAGSCLVTQGGKFLTMTKDTAPVDLPANEPHEIKALEDGTVFVNMFAAT
jgi:quercetin dioxygenase-like cupin family protein